MAVLVGADSADVLVIDLAQGASLRRLRGHNSKVIAARFGSRGELFTASQDGTAAEWNLRTATLVQRFRSRQFIADLAIDDAHGVIVALDGRGGLNFFERQRGRSLGVTTGNGRLGVRLWLAADGKTAAALGIKGDLTFLRIPYDETPTAQLERELACKAPAGMAMGMCQ
jgi:hypothetical protein